MKSAKQNTIRQSIDQHRITLIESETFHYYSLVLNKARHADDGYKKNGPREASATLIIKLDPASKLTLDKHFKMPKYITHGLVHKKD